MFKYYILIKHPARRNSYGGKYQLVHLILTIEGCILTNTIDGHSQGFNDITTKGWQGRKWTVWGCIRSGLLMPRYAETNSTCNDLLNDGRTNQLLRVEKSQGIEYSSLKDKKHARTCRFPKSRIADPQAWHQGLRETWRFHLAGQRFGERHFRQVYLLIYHTDNHTYSLVTHSQRKFNENL